MPSNRHEVYLQELPRDWLQVPIKKLGKIFSGGTPSRDISSFWDGTIAWVTPGELVELENKYIRETREYISDKGLANSAGRLLPPGSLLITTRATIGSIAIAGIPICTNQGFKNVVTDKFHHSLFYYYLLSWLAPEMQRLASGSTFDEISQRDFVKIVVPQPPLSEQRHIAGILDTIDAHIQHTNQLIAKLKLLKAGLLYKLLINGLNEHGQLRDPVAHPEQFKASPVGRVPKEWKVQPLVSFAQDTKTSFVNGPFGSDLLAKEFLKEGIPVIYVRDVKPGVYERISTVHVSANKAESLSFCNVQYGDVLVAKVGDPPCDAAPYFLREKAIITQDVIRIRVREDVHTSFLSNLLNSDMSKRAIRAITIIGTRKRVSLTDFKSIELPKPPFEEQVKIVEILDAIDANIHAEEGQLNKLELYKKGLMHDLLAGRVRTVNVEGCVGDIQYTAPSI